jgi:hypothetical protein
MLQEQRQPSPNVIIHCTDNHLSPGGGLSPQGRFPDTLRPGVSVQTQPGDRACGNLQGFAYVIPQGIQGFPQTTQVVVLCSGTTGALQKYAAATFGSWRTVGDLRKTAAVKPTPQGTILGIDWIRASLSYKVLHELMHASSETGCKF